MNKIPNTTSEKRQDALRPIASLISKSEKALQKLTPGTWQHTRIRDNLQALNLASVLIHQKGDSACVYTKADLQAALEACNAMRKKTENAQAGFSPGTSQHTLLQNRSQALSIAETLLQRELEGS